MTLKWNISIDDLEQMEFYVVPVVFILCDLEWNISINDLEQKEFYVLCLVIIIWYDNDSEYNIFYIAPVVII